MIGLNHRYFEEIAILVTFYFMNKSFKLGVVHSIIRISLFNCSQSEVPQHDSEPLEEVLGFIIIILFAIMAKEEEVS